ncbi:MAG: flagellar export chaperone FliS [Lachnospiraceae bacterium]|nr:flagellar export chaperone FliS [Lachnospiraceae bacterium]
MDSNAINAYQRNAILTASPAELTLMLYNGAIKFCNIGIASIEKKDYETANTNIKKANAIITELRATLDHKYPVWEDFERVYDYISRRLLDANIQKDTEILEEALKYIREMRDTWQEVIRLSKEEGK